MTLPQPKPIDESTTTIEEDDDVDDDAFMNDILNEMTGPPTHNSGNTTTAVKEKEDLDTIANNEDFSQDLLAGMERMMREMGMAAEPDQRSSSTDECTSFQARIQKTVNQLEEPTPIGTEDDDELISNLMSEMEHLADTPEFESVLETMMQSLMSKEILHEPMRDLCSQYPDYIKSHPEMPDNERQKLLTQLELMQQVNLIYETQTHTNESSPRILELMAQIQALGQPPAELMSGLVPDGAGDKECCIM